MRRLFLLMVGLSPIVIGTVAQAQVAAAQQSTEPVAKGVIYGTVFDPDGQPAKDLGLTAHPLGVALGAALPYTKTDQNGNFRFAVIPWWGRYTVFADDENAGYSQFSNGPNDPASTKEVTLSPELPEAEFNLHLPPKAGFLLFHLTDQRTGAAISGVEVTVNSAASPSRLIFSGGFPSSKPVLVPSDENLLLHVTSWGFREWDQSIGNGMPIRIAPGHRLTLDVQLQPANPLRERIRDADPKKYQGIHDGKDWKNPCLIVRTDGIVILAVTSDGNPIAVKAVAAALEGLPDSAWPYGFVVAIQDNGIAASESERSQIEANRYCSSRSSVSLE